MNQPKKRDMKIYAAHLIEQAEAKLEDCDNDRVRVNIEMIRDGFAFERSIKTLEVFLKRE